MKPEIDLHGERMLVVGLARTGRVTAIFSAAHGAKVTASDEKPETKLTETAAQLRAAGVKLKFGAHTPALFLEQDLIVISPGVPAKLPALELARARGIPVVAGRAHPEDGWDCDARRREHRRAAAVAGRLFYGFERDGCRDQQLPTGGDSGFPAGSWGVAEPHARSPRPARIVRGICGR